MCLENVSYEKWKYPVDPTVSVDSDAADAAEAEEEEEEEEEAEEEAEEP